MFDVCVHDEEVLVRGFPSLSGLLGVMHDTVNEPSISGTVEGQQEGTLRIPLNCGVGEDQDKDDADQDEKTNACEPSNVP